MAIRISSISLPVRHRPEDLKKKILSLLHLREQELLSFEIIKRSLDARKKDDIRRIYTVDVKTGKERQILKRNRDPKIAAAPSEVYTPPVSGREKLPHRPVIIGAGPAGLFAGLLLAEQGYCPLILERGLPAEERKISVEHFWETGELDPESNVSFGEGGAGTFSDGKLNTMVKDSGGRNRKVLETFVRFGADREILWEQKPHVGTDRLIGIVSGIREEIRRLGGDVRFRAKAEHLVIREGKVTGVQLSGGETIPCEVLITAAGHSARDTFTAFLQDGVAMEAKAFAVGLRVQHSQRMIDLSQFGEKEADYLSPAAYKLTAKSRDQRGVYTFCMCPGGYVVDASSEPGRTAVNGMSYHGRASETANSAVIVSVTPEDFGAPGPLAGIRFQQKLEERAFRAGSGRIPVQLYGDFRNGSVSREYGDVVPCFRGRTAFADLNPVLGPVLSGAFTDGMERFGQILKGFSGADTILAGVESRTSSPVRIPRNELFESGTKGLYPCGEGAGYAGGITSAAMDGLRVAEAVIRRFDVPMQMV